jgi:SAM-dependent methyltransferase
MGISGASIGTGAGLGLSEWLQTPAGAYLLAWEQKHVDQAVADVFGFHAVQFGMPQLQALRANRMPDRWLALDGSPDPSPADSPLAAAIQCDFDALPFDNVSLDLVVLPHALELARDPHLALREVERVLRPEGRVVIIGFNPNSLWGLRQRVSHLSDRVSAGRGPDLILPRAGEFLGHRRLRDWLHLLSFEVESGGFGCYRPPFQSEKWLGRFEWTERAGERWWPMLGAVYSLTAVKRVRGMRLVGLVRKQRQRANAVASPAVASHHHQVLEPSAAEPMEIT